MSKDDEFPTYDGPALGHVTDAELAMIKADAATPGPWTYGTVYAGSDVVPLAPKPVYCVQATSGDVVYIANALDRRDQQIENARFVATARSDVPRLAAEVERLKEIIKMHDLCHDLHGKVGQAEFEEGCRREAIKVFGGCRWADEIDRLRFILKEIAEHVPQVSIMNPAEDLSCFIDMLQARAREACSSKREP